MIDLSKDVVILFGPDRVGKSTIAEYYRKNGYEVRHMGRPDPKYSQPGYVGPSYIDDCVDILTDYINKGKKVVFDRSWYGEIFVWPFVYNRLVIADKDSLEVIREIEASINIDYIYVTDPDMQAHWKRCVDNNEPLTKQEFITANRLYDATANEFGFRKVTLPLFLESINKDVDKKTKIEEVKKEPVEELVIEPLDMPNTNPVKDADTLTPEQKKLEKANIINTVLSSRIIKKRGGFYDELETEIRDFLNKKIKVIFGENQDDLSKDEVQILKLLCRQMQEKLKTKK